MIERVEHLAEGVSLYLGDARAVLPTLARADAIVTDPPYGMNAAIGGITAGKSSRWALSSAQSAWAEKPQSWDAEAPPIVLEFPKMADQIIVWGGQFFAMPPARGWLVWNKIIRNFSSSVCELAWTNLEKPVDCFDYSHGQLASEGKFHPTQKPLPLMGWCVRKTTGAVLDPFMGSGTTGVAAVRAGRPFTGVEIVSEYFDVARRRISDALRAPDLFVEQPARAEKPAELDLTTGRP